MEYGVPFLAIAIALVLVLVLVSYNSCSCSVVGSLETCDNSLKGMASILVRSTPYKLKVLRQLLSCMPAGPRNCIRKYFVGRCRREYRSTKAESRCLFPFQWQ
jgi:hypothetical protein